MNTAARLAMLLLLGIACIACNSQSNAPAPPSSPSCSLLPGDIGNWWIYTDSSWRDGKLASVRDDTLRITGTALFQGKTLSIPTDVPLLPSRFLPGCDTVYIESYGIGGMPFLTPYYIRGTATMETLFTVIGDVGFYYSAQILPDAIVTPAGAFSSCTRIGMFSQQTVDDTFLFPGVGIIRRNFVADVAHPDNWHNSLTLRNTNVVLNGR